MISRSIATVFLLAAAAVPTAASVQAERLDAMRYALLVSPAEGSGMAELEAVLRDSYGYQAIVLPYEQSTRAAILETMSGILDIVRPFDEVITVIGLPILQDTFAAKVEAGLGLTYLPPGSARERPWTLLPMHEVIDWTASLPTGASLVVHPGCGGAFHAAEDALLARLDRGKRPGALNVLLVCDQQRDLAFGRVAMEPRRWRADELVSAMAHVLAEAADPEVGGLGSIDLAHRLAAEVGEMRLEVRTYPDGAGEVRFQSTSNEVGYRKRYEQAVSYDAARQVLADFAVAAKQHPALAPSLVRLLGEVAMDVRAAASSARPDERAALEVRRAAIDLLQLDGSGPAREMLATLATQASVTADVRSYAVTMLSRLPESAARERSALRRALGDDDAGVREAAALGLVPALDSDAAPSLRRLLRSDPSLGVRRAALQALSALRRDADRDLFVAALEDAAPELRQDAAAALAGLGPSSTATTALLALLANDADEQVRRRAASALGNTVTDALRARTTAGLVAVLRGGSELVARAAAESLGRVGNRESERALIEALTGRTSEGVRVASVEALGRMRSVAAIAVLERIADVECTLHAEKVAEQQSPELGIVGACLEPPAVRRAAVSALVAIGADNVAAMLFAKLEDPDPYVRREALGALSLRGSKEAAYLPENLAQQSASARGFTFGNVADPSDPRGLEILLGGLSDEDRTARAVAIERLAELTEPTAISRVVDVLRGGDIVGRQSAAEVLGRVPVDDAAVVEALVAGSRDGSSAVRAAAIRSLGRREDARGRETLLAALEDPAADVRRVGAESLAWLVDEPQVRLRLESIAKSDAAPEVRSAAISTLTGAEAKLRK